MTDGLLPIGGLVQATDGNFYGTTVEGGVKACKVDRTHSNPNGVNEGCGTIFKITPWRRVPLITTTVPAGATTGTINVVTPSGTLASNVSFQVP